MSIPHNYTVIGSIMNAMSGGGGGGTPGAPNIVSVVGPSSIDEGSAATITVTTENFPDGDTTLNWTISQNASDFVVSSGTVVIKAGAIQTVFQEVSGALVDIEKETGDDVYTYTFSGTLSGSGLGFGYPLLPNEEIGSSGYYRGTSTGVIEQYRVNERVTIGGNGISTFTVTPELDGVVEGSETFTVTVSGTVDGTPVTRTSAPITINDINNATSIPVGVFTGRPAPAPGSTAPVAYCRSEEVSDGGETVTATARVSTSIYREDYGVNNDVPGFSIVVQAVEATDTSEWYTPSGSAVPLSATPVEIYRNANVTPTAVRIVYRLVAADGTHIGSDVNLGWQPAGPGDTASFSRSASAGAGADSFRGGTIEVDFYGRADGFLDTLLATFQYRVEAYADGANF